MELKPQNQKDIISGWCSNCKRLGSVTEFWSAEIPTKNSLIICLELWVADCGNNLLCILCAQNLLEEAMEHVLDAALERK